MFSGFLNHLKKLQEAGSSELPVGLILFTLAVSRMSERILEIGRHKGFSTFALAAGLKYLDEGVPRIGWNCQRPEIDYDVLFQPKKRILYSLDPDPKYLEYCRQMMKDFDLEKYVKFETVKSQDYKPEGEYDIVFIDGDHSYQGCKNDVEKYVPFVAKNGYFILHDYFSFYSNFRWYPDYPYGGKFIHGENSINNSPIKKVCDEIKDNYEHFLLDTNFMSVMVFRRSV